MIQIRQATLADKPAIFDFLSIAYAEKAQYKFPERWEWQFEHNPFNNGDELPVWIAVDEINNKVIGQICTMNEPFMLGIDKNIILYWAVDLFVLPEYREHKIGFKLSCALFEDNHNTMALPMSGAFRHYLTKMGSHTVNPVSTWRRIAHMDQQHLNLILTSRLGGHGFGKALRTMTGFFRVDRMVAGLINLAVRLRDQKYLSDKKNGITIDKVIRFDQSFDRLWEQVATHIRAGVQRTSQFLTWKYHQQPHMNYQVFGAYKENELCGYIILRCSRPPESNMGIIADLLAPPDDDSVLCALIAHAVKVFKTEKVTYIHAASSIPAYQAAFEALGFKKEKEMLPLFLSKQDLASIRQALEPGSWFLGRSDHDWDQFPYI